MRRIKKLLWILFILWIVFFIICDERGIKIWFENNHIVLHQTEKFKISKNEKSEVELDPNLVYKNSDLIHINYEFENPKTLRESNGVDPEFFKEPIVYKTSSRIKIYTWFENPITLRNSAGMDPEYVAKVEKEQAEIKARDENMRYKWPNFISMDESNITSNIKQKDDKQFKEESDSIIKYTKSEHKINLNKSKTESDNKSELIDNSETDTETNIEEWYFISNVIDDNWTESDVRDVLWDVKKLNEEYSKNNSEEKVPEENKTQLWWSQSDPTIWNEIIENDYENESDTLNNNTEITENEVEQVESFNVDEAKKIWDSIDQWGKYTDKLLNKVNTEVNNKPQKEEKSESKNEWWIFSQINEELTTNITPENKETVQIEEYQLKRHNLNIRKWIKIVHEFVVPQNEEINNYNPNNWNSQIVLEDIISSDELDINTLESENDEFLQAVFKKTKDTKVMNLIVETYLSEYQFVKAKKFIESLSEAYSEDLDPLLNLRVVFNSFALTSNTSNSTLKTLVEDYKLKNKISEEDRLWYLWVVALMQKDYDHFFELANSFTLESHKNLASKLQWYKDQIAKQMWMPDYYFDTLVALELFNQGLFQPAKVLALYSLQQNSNYILPYQILAYANFLTNSRDTSIEYLRKLIDIDPNNAEKYRFLMWIAYYWDEKYEQSVVMLSLVKKQSLRIDAERYLIRDYIYLDQKTRLISIWNKMLWYDNLVSSDFYTYFYEAFYRPFAEWTSYQIFAYDSELANKMIRVCSMKLSDEEKTVCNYWMIGKNVALWQYDWLEDSLLKLATEYPQWYLYQALWEYYLQQWDTEKAKAYLLKAVSMTKNTSEVVQIKKLLQDTM